jgi:hypothetical protein
MSKGQKREYQWNIIVDAKLDKAARQAAKDAGMQLSSWIRAVVRKQLGWPTI